MSHDIIADVLNKLVNAKNAGKTSVESKFISKPMVALMEIAKSNNYIKNFKVDDKKMVIEIGEVNKCGAIKPRYYVKKNGIEKYMKRYLPARDVGILVISTNQGMMVHNEAIEKGLGGCLIAYFY